MLNPLKIFLLLLVIYFSDYQQNFCQTSVKNQISGTIFFNSETYLQFDDILYIHGSIAPTSRLNKLKSIKVLHENTIRVISLTFVKFLRIDRYSVGISQYGNEVLHNAQIQIETKSRQSLDMPYFELEWVLVRVKDKNSRNLIEKQVMFVENGKLNIKKIVFD